MMNRYETLTRDENALINHWSMWGSESIVTKYGPKRWVVEFRSISIPLVFKTKTAAVEAGTNLVLALSHRGAGFAN